MRIFTWKQFGLILLANIILFVGIGRWLSLNPIQIHWSKPACTQIEAVQIVGNISCPTYEHLQIIKDAVGHWVTVCE